MLTLLPKGVQKKSKKKFLIEDFFHFPPESISPKIFEKIRNGPNGLLRDLGETDS